jgi:rod shape-determining protein MreC
VPYQDKHFEQQIKVPVTWVVLGIVAVIAVMSFLLLLGDRRGELEPQSYGSRSNYDSVASLPNQGLAYPAHKAGDFGSWFGDYFFAVRENRILKKKVADLSQYRDLYLQQRDINNRYEKLLNLRTEPPVDTVTARSVAVSRGPFNNNRLIDAGSAKGVRFGNPVITEQGLVGQVVAVSQEVSRVLMVTDPISRIPIMIARSDARAILQGDGGDFPRLEFVRGRDAVKKGDQVLSSGDGGVFPRGLPVGEAVQGLDGVWRVKLYANRGPIDYIKVLKFEDFSRLPNADQILNAPSITDVLPPPPLPQASAASSATSVSAQPASSASASSSSRVSATPQASASVSRTTQSQTASPAAAASTASGRPGGQR